ncbi:MAG: 50S ribosomal protein L17 [Thermodesulfovibrionia bacterium]|nr:50S ribosomal protein L17 [Thermodesulfovibrionia bacterium]
MRHRVAGRGFGRNTNQRKALLRCLTTSLFEHLKIETTVAKAKETRKAAERIITLGRRGDLHSRRLALSRLPNKRIVSKLFGDIAPKLNDRKSGYLRIIKTRVRPGDNSSLAVLEFVDYEMLKEKKEEKSKEEKKPKKEKKKETS